MAAPLKRRANASNTPIIVALASLFSIYVGFMLSQNLRLRGSPAVYTPRAAAATIGQRPSEPATQPAPETPPAISALASRRWPLCDPNVTAAPVIPAACPEGGGTRFMRIDGSVPIPTDIICHWTNLSYPPTLRPLKMCTHDPAIDTTISRNLHRFNAWESYDMMALISRLVKTGTICSRERPFVLDLGMNIGVFTMVFLELGCHVVAFEPLSANLFRARESARANGLDSRLTLYKNAVSNKEAPLFVELNSNNPGASTARTGHDAVRGGGKAAGKTLKNEECVMGIALDVLFQRPDRPLSPTTHAPMRPDEISFLKVDIEGFDVAAYDGMQGVLTAGHPIPFATMEYNQAQAWASGARCLGEGALHMMSDLGYEFWDHHDTPLEADALLALAEATSERIPKAQRVGVQPGHELWMQHSSVDTAGVAGLKRVGDKAGRRKR